MIPFLTPESAPGASNLESAEPHMSEKKLRKQKHTFGRRLLEGQEADRDLANDAEEIGMATIGSFVFSSAGAIIAAVLVVTLSIESWLKPVLSGYHHPAALLVVAAGLTILWHRRHRAD